jgi:hypothetical protein
MREVWGAFAVNDHLRKRAFVADVLLYDRLLVPVPFTAKARAEWRDNGWAPDALDRRLDVIEHHNPDAVLRVPWTNKRSTRVRRAWARQVEVDRTRLRGNLHAEAARYYSATHGYIMDEAEAERIARRDKRTGYLSSAMAAYGEIFPRMGPRMSSVPNGSFVPPSPTPWTLTKMHTRVLGVSPRCSGTRPGAECPTSDQRRLRATQGSRGPCVPRRSRRPAGSCSSPQTIRPDTDHPARPQDVPCADRDYYQMHRAQISAAVGAVLLVVGLAWFAIAGGSTKQDQRYYVHEASGTLRPAGDDTPLLFRLDGPPLQQPLDGGRYGDRRLSAPHSR